MGIIDLLSLNTIAIVTGKTINTNHSLVVRKKLNDLFLLNQPTHEAQGFIL